MNNCLLIRADATFDIGTGHLLRCLALAQAWRMDGGKVVFLTNCVIHDLLKRIVNEGFELYPINSRKSDSDLSQTIKFLESLKPDWCVLDGEHFDSAFQNAVKNCASKLMVIDDFNGCKQYYADIILNQNFNAEVHEYNVKNDTIKLLGTKYVMLRQEFCTDNWDVEEPIRKNTGKHSIVVSFGGSDPHNLTGISLKALPDLESLQVETTILVGAGNDRSVEYKRVIKKTGLSVKIICNAKDISGIFRKADVALICAGGTLWECMYLGCPVLSFSLNIVQHDILTKLHKNMAVMYLGYMGNITTDQLSTSIRNLLLSDSRRNEMRRNSAKLIDGKGSRRVVKKMKFF